jgi:hypothetical protein
MGIRSSQSTSKEKRENEGVVLVANLAQCTTFSSFIFCALWCYIPYFSLIFTCFALNEERKIFYVTIFMYERYSRFQSLRNQLFFLEETSQPCRWVPSPRPETAMSVSKIPDSLRFSLFSASSNNGWIFCLNKTKIGWVC